MDSIETFEQRIASVCLRFAGLALRALVVFTIVAALLLAGAWTANRKFGWQPPAAIANLFVERTQAAEALLYVYDKDTGWRANPYTQLHHVLRGPFQRGEPQDVRLRTNAEGFFDRDHSLATPYYRIAFVGDSWVEAQQVDATHRFTQLVEDYVPALSKGAKAVETMNFGWSNLGTAQELGVVRTYVAKYKPDEIWLVFNPADDVSDSSPLFTAPPLGPTFAYEAGGTVNDVRFGQVHPAAIAERMRRERYGPWADLAASQVLPYLFAAQSHPAFEAAFREMHACFRLLIRSAGTARVTVLYVPPEREMSAEAWAEYSARARKAAGRALTLDPMHAERRIAAMAAQEGAAFVSLRGLVAEKGPAEIYQAHFSRMGHHWVADFIARRILDSGCCAAPVPPR